MEDKKQPSAPKLIKGSSGTIYPFDDVETRQAKIYNGVKFLFSLKLDEASQYFDKLKNDDIHYWAMHTLTNFVRVMQTDDKKAKQACSRQISAVIKAATAYCHMQSSSMDDLLSAFKDKERPTVLQMQERAACQIIAFLLGLKASLQVQAGNYLKAGVTFRKCWKFYEECWKVMEANPNANINRDYQCDVLLGVGLFNFVISLVPPTFMNFVEIIGFKGDRKLGFDLLRQCSKRESATGLVASTVLQAIYQFYLVDYKGSLNVLEDALQKYPDNMVALFSGGYSMRFLGKVQESETYFIRVHDNSAQIPQLQLSCTYELGTSAVKRSAWQEAIPKFEKYLKETQTEGYRCYCAFELGVCYCFAKQPEKAIKLFQQCAKWVREDYPFDVYAGRKAKEFLLNKTEPMSPFEMIYFESRERYKVSQFKESLKLLNVAKGMKVNSEQRACFYWIYGQNLRKLGKGDKAQKYLENALKEKVKVETLVPPHALVELAELYFSRGEIEKADQVLTEAKNNYKAYDFQNPLLRQIARLADDIKGVTYNS